MTLIKEQRSLQYLLKVISRLACFKTLLKYQETVQTCKLRPVFV